MRNLLTLGKSFWRYKTVIWSLSLLLSVGVGKLVRAESPQTAPAQLKEMISELESEANQGNLKAVMEFYDSDFTNSDGLKHTDLETALANLWERYPGLSYSTELLSWEQQGEELVAETITYLRGIRRSGSRLIFLTSSLRSRQYITEDKIVRQEILAETTRLKTGLQPPTVKVIMPEKVKVGEEFNFDVIVQEPLGNDLLLGTAIEESTNPDLYLEPSPFALELLSAGGIYKIVEAPEAEGNRWISAILVRGDGITIATQRVVVKE